MTDPSPTNPKATTAPVPARRARFRLLTRFRRSQDGATAVEFAFISIPFLMLLTAILETALLFWTSQVLEEAVSQTSRRLLTGEALTRYTGNAATNTQAFKNDVCANAPGLVDCSKLVIDVRTYSSFANAKNGTDGTNPISAGGLNTTGFGYSAPQPQQIVVVRAVLEYPLYFTYWSASLANIGSGRRGIVASATFRTEPFNAPAT
ncbi:MAG TPA: TadE/TadG family type IV pilus assembly protein [Bosea sp. (in: a-proteobacteria)]|jgi:pilus assembly protein Flp/PilA|uniref:TadE/TadG family type IV pilus assembly protein n=1 Tax=Bosea sp. (in: a-proteobacteria) TaxID=1871050 RepID=UPI002DDCD25D|nr:TadE/TadG family type IV pilus assembly protein [Bosea sp. (in: a-proteobacteria)]HEV2556611.1 TadE/TadG family type IV pilus assembly protein [Bosea sp. (in: a-proteobacteria)]